MIRVLHAVNNMHRAGIETTLMNYYRNIDRSKIQFDFLTHRPERDDYDNEIEELGGRVFYAPRLYPQNYPKYFKFMKRLFCEHPEYRIVHSHIDAMSYMPLLAAKKSEIPIRIAHSHSTSIDRDFKYPIKLAFREMLPGVATHRFACGEEAGKFLFKQKSFFILPNAVNSSDFSFSEETRSKKRNELKLENKFVLGHIGRFYYPKNHEFLIDIFECFLKLNQNSVLLLAGDGEKLDSIKELTQKKGISDKVLFLGNRNDAAELYQAMDCFVLPSLFEGIPVVGIEAQFAGLPCFFSDRVSKEVAFSYETHFLPLEKGPEFWAKEVFSASKGTNQRQSALNNKFDILNSAKALEEKYITLYNSNGE